MKTPKTSGDNANVEENGIEDQTVSLVENAPHFSEDINKVESYIRDEVVKIELDRLKDKYTNESAELAGRDDGGKNGDQYPFQNDCRTAYLSVILCIGKTISGIVKREKDEVEKVLKQKLPNMEENVERKIDRNAVRNLMDTADTLNKTEQAADKFLRDRGLNLTSYESQKGADHNHWKFWLPLTVILLIEVFANYVFLYGARLSEKSLITATAVVVVFVCGFSISWCFKAKTGIRVRDNKFIGLQKGIAWAGIALVSVGFTLCLIFFVYYRAGEDLSSVTEVLSQLANAFTNAITDLGLALLNVVFLFVAIVTFHNAGWRIRKYGNVAKDRAKHKQEYKQIRADMDSKARLIFDAAIASVQLRQEKVSEIELNYKAIKAVCEDVPRISKEITGIITNKYEMSIRKYRDGFKGGRNPNDKTAADLSQPIPDIFRTQSPITSLETSNSTHNITALQALCEMDFPNEIACFNKAVEKWENENNQFGKLNEFAQEHIKQQKARIRKESKDDGIENSTKKSGQSADER